MLRPIRPFFYYFVKVVKGDTMKNKFGVYNPKKKRYEEFFEFPKQAERFIDKKGSKALRIVDLRKKKLHS